MSASLPSRLFYLCGPMGGCKSDATLDVCDYNYPTFQAIERTLREKYERDGYRVFAPDEISNEGRTGAFHHDLQAAADAARKGGQPLAVILNPARIQLPRDRFAAGAEGEHPYWLTAMLVTSRSLFQSHQETLGLAKLTYVLTPPAHDVTSTPEAPKLKHWTDSKGAPIEVFNGLTLLDASFERAVPNGDGAYDFRSVSAREVEKELALSKGMNRFLRHAEAPKPAALQIFRDAGVRIRAGSIEAPPTGKVWGR